VCNSDKIGKAAPLDFEPRSKRHAGYRFKSRASGRLTHCPTHLVRYDRGRCCTCDYIASKEQDRKDQLNRRSIVEQPPKTRRVRQDPEFRSAPWPEDTTNPFYQGTMDDWPDWGICACGARRRQDARGVGCPDCKARLSPKGIRAAVMTHRAKGKKNAASR